MSASLFVPRFVSIVSFVFFSPDLSLSFSLSFVAGDLHQFGTILALFLRWCLLVGGTVDLFVSLAQYRRPACPQEHDDGTQDTGE